MNLEKGGDFNPSFSSHLVLVEEDSLYCYADISAAESESGNNSLKATVNK